MYEPITKANQLVIGSGDVVVVSGWTPRERVQALLEPRDYAAIGSLYSPTRGIDFLIRNLLANPQIGVVVGLSATDQDVNARGVVCLSDLFRNGVQEGVTETGQPCWKINSLVDGVISKDIPLECINAVLQSIEFLFFHSLESLVTFLESRRTTEFTRVTDREKILIPPSEEPTSESLPGPRYGHIVRGKTIADAWPELLHRIRATGKTRESAYDSKWQELIDMMVIIDAEPPEGALPEPNYLPCDRSFLASYVEQFVSGVTNGGADYTYGQRLRSMNGCDQIEQAIAHLVDNPNSARAVMSLWTTQDYRSGNPPCLNHIWVRISEEGLSLTATFRSNDMFSAWPSNAFGLRHLQEIIRLEISKRLGRDIPAAPLVTVSQSAHIYDDCWSHADKVIDECYLRKTPVFDDPIGSFVIATDGNQIQVQQITPGNGAFVTNYSGRNFRVLGRRIIQQNPAIAPGHAFYLGGELARAEIAIRRGTVYSQDR